MLKYLYILGTLYSGNIKGTYKDRCLLGIDVILRIRQNFWSYSHALENHIVYIKCRVVV